MTDPTLVGWAIVAVTLALAALAMVMSAMLERTGPIRLRHWSEAAGGRLGALYAEPFHFELFRYLLNLAAKSAPPVALAVLIWVELRGGRGIRSLWLSLLVVLVFLTLVELINRTLVIRHSERVLERLTVLYRAALALAWPLLRALAVVLPREAVQRRGLGDEDEASDEEIEAFLDVGTSEGILDPGEEDMILRVIDFGDARVKSVMTPRIDMVCAAADSPLEELARLFLDSGHSRIPLYRESVDRIVGVLHIRALFGALRSGEPQRADALVLPPYFVPETKRLTALLRELQAGHQQMAIAVDEFGGTAGLVTVEDLLEEIVGEIADEHEADPQPNERLPDGSWRIDAMSNIDCLREIFDVPVEGEPYQTVGGMIFGLHGEIPEAGSAVEAFGLRFVVELVEGRRIQSLRVTPVEGR